MEAFQDYAAPGRLAVSELMDATIVSCNYSKAAVDSALCSNAARQVAIACKPRSTLVAFLATGCDINDAAILPRALLYLTRDRFDEC